MLTLSTLTERIPLWRNFVVHVAWLPEAGQVAPPPFQEKFWQLELEAVKVTSSPTSFCPPGTEADSWQGGCAFTVTFLCLGELGFPP